MPLRTVNPGEVILASDWNAVIQAINALESRLSTIVSGGPPSAPRITQVLPTGPRTAGDEIRIYGSNFGFSAGAQSVYFGETRAIGFLPGSSDTLLVVQLPEVVVGATEAGTAMTMSVGNQHGFTTWAITIRAKPEPTTGGFQLTYARSQPATPTANQEIFYDFVLRSFASRDLVLTLAPDIRVILPLPAGVPDPGLPGQLTVIDADGTERPGRDISLPEGATKTIRLRLRLPDGTNRLRYSLSLSASAPGVPTVVEPLPNQEVGQAGEQPDPTVTNFEFSQVAAGTAQFSSDTGGVSGVDGTLRIPASTTATIEMRTQFSNIPAGTTNQYQLAAVVEAPAGGWSAAVNPVLGNPLPVTGPGGLIPTFFDLTAPATAATAIVRLTLTRQGVATNNRRSAAYRLLLS